MKNFDLRKFLSENKLTPTSKIINEEDRLSDLDENIFNSPQMGGVASSKGTAGYIDNTSQMDKEYSDSVRKGMFVVEKPNGDVIKYFVSEKDAMDFIDEIDPEGMRDLNIRKV